MTADIGKIKIFLFSLALCLGGGWLTGYVTQHSVKEWYPQLIKPYGTPPDVVFPIVWTILYILMALALTLVWAGKSSNKTKALLLFFAQLFLNFTWSWLFFYQKSPSYALLDIAFLLLLIGLTVHAFWQQSRLAAYLLLPYLAWVSYAAYLNFFIWLYNPL